MRKFKIGEIIHTKTLGDFVLGTLEACVTPTLVRKSLVNYVFHTKHLDSYELIELINSVLPNATDKETRAAIRIVALLDDIESLKPEYFLYDEHFIVVEYDDIMNLKAVNYKAFYTAYYMAQNNAGWMHANLVPAINVIRNLVHSGLKHTKDTVVVVLDMFK